MNEKKVPTEKGKLSDELLDKAAGGDSVSGMTSKAKCPFCQSEGPHPCTITYDTVDGKWTFKTVITCWSCGAQIQQYLTRLQPKR